MRRLFLLGPLLVLPSACAGHPALAAPPVQSALELAAPAPPAADPDVVAMTTPRIGPPGGVEGAGRRHVER